MVDVTRAANAPVRAKLQRRAVRRRRHSLGYDNGLRCFSFNTVWQGFGVAEGDPKSAPWGGFNGDRVAFTTLIERDNTHEDN